MAPSFCQIAVAHAIREPSTVQSISDPDEPPRAHRRRRLTHPAPVRVAYFSMEFGLHEEFPSYAGGLGILAGDFIKAAHDLGAPVVGVGLRWAEGYTVQRVGHGGLPVDEWQEARSDFLEDVGVRVRVRVRPSFARVCAISRQPPSARHAASSHPADGARLPRCPAGRRPAPPSARRTAT